jgi:hypothetical protein
LPIFFSQDDAGFVIVVVFLGFLITLILAGAPVRNKN